jgi:hypothetical protein
MNKKKDLLSESQQQLPVPGPGSPTGEIIIYNPTDAVRIEVLMERETVWLTQTQIGHLFGVDRTVIVRHIGNIYRTGELEESATCAKNAQVQSEGKRLVERIQNYYNLDMILSVGYRVNSRNATAFRRWANTVLKEYLLRGYVINPRLEQLERRVTETERKIDFFVKTSLPPKEGIFYDGQIFDAYEFVSRLVKSAGTSIILIDNYVDESVLIILNKRSPSVKATIYTNKITDEFKLDIERHNAQYPPVEIHIFNKAHDRFLIIDDKVYHIGASLKDLGKKWFAFSLLQDLNPKNLLSRI